MAGDPAPAAPPTIDQCLRDARRRLARAGEAMDARAGIDDPALDARLLLAAALDASPTDLFRRGPEAMPDAAAARFDRFIAARIAGQPVSRILGWRGFWTIELRITPDVLDPRPDSETVVEQALVGLAETASARLLDLGTGSGCLILALLASLPNAIGVAVDRSPAAARVARSNADRLGLGERLLVLCGDWTAAVRGPFDGIVANPPYIRHGEIAGLATEVRDHDPALALDGGTDGLDAYREILPALPGLLAPGGRACLEIGHDQADAVRALGRAAGLTCRSVARDLGGRPRCVVFDRCAV